VQVTLNAASLGTTHCTCKRSVQASLRKEQTQAPVLTKALTAGHDGPSWPLGLG